MFVLYSEVPNIGLGGVIVLCTLLGALVLLAGIEQWRKNRK